MTSTNVKILEEKESLKFSTVTQQWEVNKIYTIYNITLSTTEQYRFL